MKNYRFGQRGNLLCYATKCPPKLRLAERLKTVVLLILFFPLGCFAQMAISGRVVNQADQTPIANASVFLSNATIGAKTTEKGEFVLRNVKSGKYQLIVSVIGFEQYSQAITIGGSDIALPVVEMLPKTIGLAEVKVRPKQEGADRERNYQLFLTEFLGRSDFARDCEILNPELLNLDYDETTLTLTASSEDFLVIENNALGYKVRYLLDDFTRTSNKNNPSTKVHFEGHALFEEMQGTAQQQKRWQKKRQEVYRGSIMHFLRSVVSNQVTGEGFRVLQLATYYNYKRPADSIIEAKLDFFSHAKGRYKDSLAFWTKKSQLPKTTDTLLNFPLTAAEITSPTDKHGIFALGCDNDGLHVTYNKNGRFPSKGRSYLLDAPDNTSTTILSFNSPYVFFDSNGVMANPGAVAFNGAWGKKRIAEFLPLDYEEQPDKTQAPATFSSNAIPASKPAPVNKDIAQLLSRADSTNKNYPAEKLYLQLDKPNYAIGDTLWFKAYLFHASTLALSAKSGMMYIDIANDSNKVVKKVRLPVNQGLSWGNINLGDFTQGNYTLRAYTTWMRNFGEDCFFYQRFVIADEPKDNQDPGSLREQADAKRQAVRVKIKLEKKISQVDVQFLPEGGSLIAGLPSHIGFKAVGGDGRGVNLGGIIIDSENQQVVTFSSLHLGMGSFDLLVKPGEHYTAKVNLPDGTVRDYPLPSAKGSGTVLNVISHTDSATVSISATSDLAQSGSSYFLIGKARNVICYAAVVNFNGTGIIRKSLSKNLFPSGITHFILLDQQKQPLNERLVFIDRHDDLRLELKTDKQIYATHDSVAMHISVSDANGNPVKGNFSIAVTDDKQVNIDSLQDNIISHILLTSELKGYLEQPGYYFQKSNDVTKALDNLLLTQGWVNYDWAADNKQPAYNAEKEFLIAGKVLNAFNGTVRASKVTLFSKSPFLLRDTLTGKDGSFSFDKLPQIDTPVFFLNAVNRGNKSFNVGIVMNDPQPPVWSMPPLVAINDTIADTSLMSAAKNNRIRKEQAYLTPSGHLLKEVKIIAKKIVKDSQNLNGPGNADLVLDEADVLKERKKNWLDIFNEQIKGFRERVYVNPFSHVSSGLYCIEDMPMILIVDGILYNSIYPFLGGDAQTYFIELENYLKSNTAEDIKGIEVSVSSKYNATYMQRFFPTIIDPRAFIEVTTRSGNGPIIVNTPGKYLYKPLAVSRAAQFYSPRYRVTDTAKHLPDTRSTIYWEPNVNTDADGRATLSFYAADNPGTYTVIMQGSDMNGGLGNEKRKIIVTKQKPAGK